MTRDSAVGDTMNPASLNRYTYAHNNPSNLVDQSGNVVWVPVIVGIGAGVGATFNVLASDDKSLGGIADAAWKGAVAGAVGSGVAIIGGTGLAVVGVGGVTASVATGVGGSFAGNATLNYLDGQNIYENAIPASIAGAIFGSLGDSIVPTTGRPVSKISWFYKPKGYVGPNTIAEYDREFLSNLYSGAWGISFHSTKK